MLSDLLIGLAWLVIVLLPAIVASRQTVVSHHGYADDYMNAPDPQSATSGASDPAVSPNFSQLAE
jgi:hypothetical protein